jgi:hypothetical protein
MATLPTVMSKRNRKIPALFAAMMTLCTLAGASPAQEPIRVQTNQVLVPVVVVDKERLHRLWNDQSLYDAVLPGEVDAIASGPLVRDLTAADFQVFDNGKEQPIQNVTQEPSLYWDVRDNRGHHTEYIGPGGGKWSTMEWPPGLIGDIDWPQHYIIAYTLPESPEGSCHQIKISVNRPNVLLANRSEYCNSKRAASDPANGTKLGEQMESDLGSPKNNKVDISLIAVALYGDSDAARVHIALDWPLKSLKAESKTKGVLGMVLNRDGRLVTRFSDLADREGISDRRYADWPAWLRHFPKINVVESRYETQVKLPPGEYDLRVVLGDGKKFGQAEMPLTVDSIDRKELAISAVSLCKQINDVSAYGHASILPGAWTVRLSGNYVPLMSNDTEFKPTGNTRFKKGETLYTYFEVYEPLLAAESQATIQIQMRIVDVKTGEVKSDSKPIDATRYVRAGNPVIPIGRGIDISKLPKGLYRLDLQATDSAGRSTAWRTANFTIE